MAQETRRKAATPRLLVRVQYDLREPGHDWGPFAERMDAEQCVIALAANAPAVKTAKIIEETD
ncbi:MAG TPA: hypothetical protein VM243_16275 [Phycisphaerae bacterium]|nr:hypothetical protein [Phycisphaerae bacterium]